MSETTIATTARQPGDIHKAYLGGLYRLVEEGLDELELILDHSERANAVRGYHSRLPFNGEAESSRLTGGGTYYHLQTKPDKSGRWDVPTRCVNIIRGADERMDLNHHRCYFGEKMVDEIASISNFSEEDLRYNFTQDSDIYVDKQQSPQDDWRRKPQILGGSLRYFSFADDTVREYGKNGAFLYRACVQLDTDSFEQSIEDSQWLLERDNIDPEQYKEAITPVSPDFYSSLNESHVEPEDLVKGSASIDAVVWAVQNGDTYEAQPRFLRDNPVRTQRKKDPRPCLPATSPGWSYQARTVAPPTWYQDIKES